MVVEDLEEPVRPELTIKPDEAFYILLKAREFDEKTAPVDEDSGSDPVDDDQRDVVEAHVDDTVDEELASAIWALNDDARLDLLALIFLGRGDYSLEEWSSAREAAADVPRRNTLAFVSGTPLVSDFLDEALAQFGLSLEDHMAN